MNMQTQTRLWATLDTLRASPIRDKYIFGDSDGYRQEITYEQYKTYSADQTADAESFLDEVQTLKPGELLVANVSEYELDMYLNPIE